MKKYLANRCGRIDKVEITRETDASVWVQSFGTAGTERRRSKLAEDYGYFDSWGEARAWLIKMLTRDVESARRSLEYAKGKLGNAVGMKPPEDDAP